jgi:serine/threonine protein kinase
MVRPDGYVKLVDFGLARAQPDRYGSGSTAAGRSSTEAGRILGTIGYMAPEQARGEAVAAEADVFSLGVVLYELVTGRHPFMAASQLGTLNALLWDTPEPPSLLNPELPRALDQLILESLQKDQRLRPGASEVMYRLALAHDSNIATALSAVTVSPRRGRQRRTSSGARTPAALNHEFERAHRAKPDGRDLGRGRRRQDHARRRSSPSSRSAASRYAIGRGPVLRTAGGHEAHDAGARSLESLSAATSNPAA